MTNNSITDDRVATLLATFRARFDGTNANDRQRAAASLVSLALGEAINDPRVGEFRHLDNVRSYGDRADPVVSAFLQQR